MRDSEISRRVRNAANKLADEIDRWSDFAAECSRQQHVEPTWTSRKGVTMRLKDMPTLYLRNVKNALARAGMSSREHPGPGHGLYSAVCEELTRRDD